MLSVEKNDKIFDVLNQYWGYQSFLPIQEEVITSILENKDSLTVLPTGGGKSLCFQLPALLSKGLAIIISPLISLMKDQVDSLKDMGIAAECLNSSLSAVHQKMVIEKIQKHELKLLYISPERLQFEPTVSLLNSVPISFFVIDEAHCISHWGHDFRADYRNLNFIKNNFHHTNIHAFTATATKVVQNDIVQQLGLIDPQCHIGYIDRPNLVYRVIARDKILKQVSDIIKKHPDEAGILYCLRRKDVDHLSESLRGLGVDNVPYHAGLSDKIRHLSQEKFSSEKVNIIVATIAFGMGVDRSNIRFVIHAGMPKSIEHYQQETGRAGRDGLSAFCYMLYGGADYRLWSYFSEASAEWGTLKKKLGTIYNFCTQPQCRHKLLVKYFGQQFNKDSCDACDYCLKELDMVDDALIVGQKILSCVHKVKKESYGFGMSHVVDVLKGKSTEKIKRMDHQRLSTFGIMQELSENYLHYMIEQLVGQDYLVKDSQYSTLSITALGGELLKGKIIPVLAKPLKTKNKKEIEKKRANRKEVEWVDIDQKLFQKLRAKRTELAAAKGVPAYIIFSDKTLRDLAAKKPLTKTAFSDIYGVGQSKLEAYSELFIKALREYEDSLAY